MKNGKYVKRNKSINDEMIEKFSCFYEKPIILEKIIAKKDFCFLKCEMIFFWLLFVWI